MLTPETFTASAPAAGAANGQPVHPVSAEVSFPHAASPAPRHRLALLDGLRFAAALSVLSYHFTVRDSTAWGRHPWEVFPGVSDVTQYADLGVNLFFVISGFVVLMTAWGRTPAEFAASRVARLFPAYWVAVALTAGLLIVVWPQKGLSAWEAIANLTMAHQAADITHVDGVYWTLWVELRFYLLIGLLTLVGVTTKRVVALIVLWPVLAAMAHTTGSDLAASLLVWNYAPFFGAGMALYLVYRHGNQILNWLLVAYSWAFMVGIVGRYFPRGVVPKTHHNPSLVVTVVVLTGCVAAVWLATTTWARRVGWVWLTTAGALTYPLYLLHEWWGWWVIDRLDPALPKYAVLLVTTVVCCLAAWLIHRLVERPLSPILRSGVLAGLTPTDAIRAGGDRAGA
jgi:peptidoglycan/LPS O-acetylase OafA/YrhL